MTQRALIETRSAPLSGDFGRDYALKSFGLTLAELEAIVGRYTKGKRMGALRYEITWKKVVRGGWVRTGPSMGGERSQGYVAKPGQRFGHAIVNIWKRNGNGEPTVLWSEDFKRLGWIPGETREQYDARHKARVAFLAPLHRRAIERAMEIARALSDDQITAHLAKREHRRFGWRCQSFPETFVAMVLDGELSRRFSLLRA